LHSPQYVRLHLIRVVDDEGQTTLDTHRLWKLLGYTLGPEALDELLGTSAAGKEAFKVGGLAGWFFQQTQDVLQSKQFVAASNLNPEDQKHVAPLLQLVLQGLRSQAKSDDRPLTSFEQIVNAMLQELPWCKGPELTPEPLRKWDERAAELRDEEMMLVAAGEELPAELKDVENLEFPFPRVKTPKGQPNASPGK
jgi:hypothetical protein